MSISEQYDTIARCNRCGFCQAACPVFRSTGYEGGVARGRLALLRGIIESHIPWNAELEGPLFDCLLCGACTANCFPAVPTADLVVQARGEYLEQVGRKPIHRLLFEYLLPFPQRLHAVARAAALGKNSGALDMAQSLGLLRIFGRAFSRENPFMPHIPKRALRATHKPGTYHGQGKTIKIGYFVGCGIDILQQAAGMATLKLLRQTALQVTVLNNCCCGLPAWAYGDVAAAQRLAEINIQAIAPGQFDLLVTDCSSCAGFLKKYQDLFDTTIAWKNVRIMDLVEWLAERPAGAFLPASDLAVTYHDPCHAVRGQNLRAQPRQALSQVPGMDYRELAEADWCCGGAGAYALQHHELATRVLERKMDHVADTRAQTLVTSCPACMIQLEHGVRRHNLPMTVKHISQVIQLR